MDEVSADCAESATLSRAAAFSGARRRLRRLASEWTELGDVIIADRVYRYDVGEMVSSQAGAAPEFQGDVMTLQLRAEWKQYAERFVVAADAPWLAERPVLRSAQEAWVLSELWGRRNPLASAEYPAAIDSRP